jgi:hypothetical protein
MVVCLSKTLILDEIRDQELRCGKERASLTALAYQRLIASPAMRSGPRARLGLKWICG